MTRGVTHAKAMDLSRLVTSRFLDRFWSKVDKTRDCWEWTAYRHRSGYGQFTVQKGVFHLAHRVSYALNRGFIPAGIWVCHHCDNPPCVRPDHLFLGTPSDNSLDMFAKGRATRSRGAARYNARLTEAAVREIRSAPAYFGLFTDLAATYGVSTTAIRRVRAHLRWRHVTDGPEEGAA